MYMLGQGTRAGEWEVTQSRVARNRAAPLAWDSKSPNTERPWQTVSPRGSSPYQSRTSHCPQRQNAVCVPWWQKSWSRVWVGSCMPC